MAVVYDARNEGVHYLDPSNALVFGLCDGTATVKETAAELAEALGRPLRDVEPEVRSVVRGLRDAELLSTASNRNAEVGAAGDADERERLRIEVPRND